MVRFLDLLCFGILISMVTDLGTEVTMMQGCICLEDKITRKDLPNRCSRELLRQSN